MDGLRDIPVRIVNCRRPGIRIITSDRNRDFRRSDQRDHRRNNVRHRNRTDHRCRCVAALVLHIERYRINPSLVDVHFTRDLDGLRDIPVNIINCRRPGGVVSLADPDRDTRRPVKRDHRRGVVAHAERHLDQLGVAVVLEKPCDIFAGWQPGHEGNGTVC